MNATQSNERRLFCRKHANLEFTLLLEKGRRFVSPIVDVSLGGARLENALPPEILGQKIQAEITLKDQEAVDFVEATVFAFDEGSDSYRVKFSNISVLALTTLAVWAELKEGVP